VGKGQREDMEEDTYTVDEAARILRVTQHRVRQMLREGGLAGERDEASGRWSIPQRAVHAMLEERREREALSQVAQNPVEAQEWLERVSGLERELGRLQGRLELTEVTESTLRESLERERQRADRLERQLEEERQRLEEERRRGFWSRLFGG
jgi:excisionase family DNA binding protein